MPSSARPADLHPFPTRRSSDLRLGRPRRGADAVLVAGAGLCARARLGARAAGGPHDGAGGRRRARRGQHLRGHARRLEAGPAQLRSEEHTSELQSRVDLVCRLLRAPRTSTLSLHDALPISGSVGLGVAQTLFSSLVQDYVRAHGWGRERPEGRMMALVGDAELDEGNIFEAMLEGWKQGLRN